MSSIGHVAMVSVGCRIRSLERVLIPFNLPSTSLLRSLVQSSSQWQGGRHASSSASSGSHGNPQSASPRVSQEVGFQDKWGSPSLLHQGSEGAETVYMQDYGLGLHSVHRQARLPNTRGCPPKTPLKYYQSSMHCKRPVMYFTASLSIVHCFFPLGVLWNNPAGQKQSDETESCCQIGMPASWVDGSSY